MYKLMENEMVRKMLMGNLVRNLPKFSIWAMDVWFLKELNKEFLNKYYGTEAKDIVSWRVIGPRDN